MIFWHFFSSLLSHKDPNKANAFLIQNQMRLTILKRDTSSNVKVKRIAQIKLVLKAIFDIADLWF